MVQISDMRALVARRPFVVRDGASMRMVAAMAGPRLPASDKAVARLTPFAGTEVESDVQYFRRRRAEERQASNEAAGPEARLAHRELAARYARLTPRTNWPYGLSRQSHAFAARAYFIGVLSQRFGQGRHNIL